MSNPTILTWSDVTNTGNATYNFYCFPTVTYGGTSIGHVIGSKAVAQFLGANCHGNFGVAGDLTWVNGTTGGGSPVTTYLYLGNNQLYDYDAKSNATYRPTYEYHIRMLTSSTALRCSTYVSEVTTNTFYAGNGVFKAGSPAGNSLWYLETCNKGIIVRDSAKVDASVIFYNAGNGEYDDGSYARLHAYGANAATVGITWDNSANPVSFSSSGLIQGAYFNATSDRRAKTNIEYLHKPVLSLVKNTPICTFTYKDSQKTSLGIIAQDLQDVELNGVPLVENIQASGKDGDYMTIRESKLVYVLWKAIQEQQKQIEALQTQIQQLKKD